MENKKQDNKFTAAEMGKLWAVYSGNSMGKCVLVYYFKHVRDPAVKRTLEQALQLCDTILKEVKKFFVQGGFPVPLAFTEEDVNLDAPKLFEDDFYLYYLQYTGKAGMSIYNAGIPIITRKDIRNFFSKTLQSTVKLIEEVNDVLIAKGILMNSPIIPVPKEVDFVKKQNYLNGFFGDVRPLHGLEIGHLYDNISNDVTSKALLLAFSQVAKDQKVRKYFLRGKKLNQKHIEKATEQLHNDNLPSPSLLDHLVTDSKVTPFSDKLMLFHKIDMFSMKIRTYANGASLNGRRDIGAMYAKFLLDVSLYVEDGANIMIDNGWMEQPPEALNREKLSSSDS